MEGVGIKGIELAVLTPPLKIEVLTCMRGEEHCLRLLATTKGRLKVQLGVFSSPTPLDRDALLRELEALLTSTFSKGRVLVWGPSTMKALLQKGGEGCNFTK